MAGITFTDLLWLQELSQVLHGRKKFYRFSMALVPSKGLLRLQDLLHNCYGHRSCMFGKPFTGFLCLKDLLRFLYAFKARGPFASLLWLQDLSQVIHGWKTFYRSSMSITPSTGLLSWKTGFQLTG